MRRFLPATGWIDLQAVYLDSGVSVRGHLAFDDEGAFETIDPIRVDTGSNGTLSLPLAHPAAGRLWISAEYGERSSTALRGRRRSWRGVATAFGVAGVEHQPMPVDVEESALDSPLLGQGWFELAAAAWIDPAGGLLAVSFEPDAAAAFIDDHPDAWVTLPWRAVKEDGHRFVPMRIAGTDFETIIDTGMDGSVFLDVPHPPPFVRKPWGRSVAFTPAGPVGPLWGATSAEPLLLGGLEVSEPFVTWLGTRSATLPRTPEGRPFAILGLEFLARHPVLLEPGRDLAHFFIGDRADLRSPVGQPGG